MDGKTIRKLRTDAGMSQKELAGEIGVSAGAVGGWETNKWAPSQEHRRKLQEVLSPSVDTDTEATEEEPLEEEPAEPEPSDPEPDTNTCDCNSDAEYDDDCCQFGAEQSDESEDQNNAEHSIPSNKRRELIKKGYKMGLKHAMLQIKTRAKKQFWDGHTNTAVELRRLHSMLSMLSSRVHDSQSK